MEAIFLKILSMLLSVLMFFNNAFSFVFPQEPVENVVGIYNSEIFETEEKDGAVSLISDYVSWYQIADKDNASLEKYDWRFFFNRNIALVTVELPNPGYTVAIASVSENGETLEISYTLTEGEGEYAQVICYEVILVETSKNIETVSVSGEIIENKPIIIPSDNYYFVADKKNINFNAESPVIVGSYSALATQINPVPFDLVKYDDIFFQAEKLAVIPVVLPGSAYEITVDSVTENGDVVEVDYTVSSNGEIGTTAEIAQFIFVEISKNITEISANETFVKFEKEYEMREFAGYNYFLCEYESFSYPAPLFSVFHSAESFKAELSEHASGFSKYDEEYFAEKSLAVVCSYFLEDGMNFRPADIEQKENRIYNSEGELIRTEQKLQISGWEENNDSSNKEGFYFIIVECNKDVDAVSLDILGLSRGYSVFDIEQFANLRLADGQYKIIYDYETWKSTADLDYFYDYTINEKFFEEKSLVLTAVVVPNEYSSIKVDSVNQKNVLVEIDCTMKPNYAPDYTLACTRIVAVETSKETSAVKLTVKNDEIVYNRHSLGKFNLTTVDEPVLVSDFEAWNSLVKTPSASFEKYDETFFKNNSLVVIPEVFTSGAIEPEVIKFYRNGENLEIVYGLNEFHEMGIDAIIEDAIIFEVIGDIKNISVERKDLKCKYRTYGNYNLFVDEPTIVSEYSEWAELVDVTNEKYSMYDEEYFKTKSVVLFTATLPDTGGRAIVKYSYEDENTLEVGYTAYSLGGFTVICYQAVLVEVDKDVTQVNISVLR